jgi:transcriptional regulator of acetoin/glycerol metabolism
MIATGAHGANGSNGKNSPTRINPEKENLEKALAAFDASVEGKSQAAASLGMSRATLYRKLRKYDLLKA